MIVEMMQPTPKDYICDPAMGSAGFLVEAVKYIKENYETILYAGEQVQHMKTSMINGYDTDQTMLRIGAMNLLLHDITAPNLHGAIRSLSRTKTRAATRSSWRTRRLRAVSTRAM